MNLYAIYTLLYCPPLAHVAAVNHSKTNVHYRRCVDCCHSSTSRCLPTAGTVARLRRAAACTLLHGRCALFYRRSAVPYVSVEDAARILRMSAWTLYRNMHQVPHIKNGNWYLIPVDFLFMEPPPVVVQSKTYHVRYYEQPMLPFDVKDVRRWRNNKKPVMLDPFGSPRK